MQDETNGLTSSQDDRNPVSAGELHAASDELHVLSAESLDRVAGGPNGSIVVQG